MKTWITVLGIASLTAIVCALLVTMGVPADSPRQAARPSAPARRLSAPPLAAPRVADELPTSDAPAEPAASDAPAVPAPPPPTPATVRDSIGVAFAADPIDSVWNGVERARLERALPALLPPGGQLRRVECRATMCRIETSLTGVDQLGTFVQRAFVSGDRVAQSGFFAGPLAEPEPGQPVVTVAYLARKGHALPMPERLAASP